MTTHITVTSTAAHVADDVVRRCIDSVQSQTFASWRHVYVLADGRSRNFYALYQNDSRIEVRDPVYPLAPMLANLWPIWQSLPDDEVIAWLDGDDRLATPHALQIVADAHARGALATYGQFMWADGSIGFAGQVGGDPRNEHWRATHLKTFRAGLVKKIRQEDLKMPDGRWTFLNDQPVMLPLLEMAGPHAVFIPNILYVYSVDNMQTERVRHDPTYFGREHAEVYRVRALPKYAQIEDYEIEAILHPAEATI